MDRFRSDGPSGVGIMIFLGSNQNTLKIDGFNSADESARDQKEGESVSLNFWVVEFSKTESFHEFHVVASSGGLPLYARL
jgi:hypothetical protein